METLETLARRMDTARDLRDLVRTMKSLAAVSIRQYERSVTALSDYDRTIELALRAVLRDGPRPRAVPGVAGGTGVLVFGSDQGLCGTFNEQVVGRVVEDRDVGVLHPGQLRVLVVGGRAAGRLGEAGLVVDEELGVAPSAASLPSLVQELLMVLDAWRAADGDLAEVLLYHNRPVGTTACKPHRQRLLPIAEERMQRLSRDPWPTRMVPRRTVPREILIGALARHYLFVTLHRALAWSSASEHASRLLAMQAAERNIDERLDQLRGAYHTRRQTAITTEVLDIVSGADALSA